jgi:hypothetical protein
MLILEFARDPVIMMIYRTFTLRIIGSGVIPHGSRCLANKTTASLPFGHKPEAIPSFDGFLVFATLDVRA